MERLQKERGLYYAHPADEPLQINGVGTEFIEILEELPDIDVMIVPLGAGSEAAAAVTVLSAFRPDIESDRRSGRGRLGRVPLLAQRGNSYGAEHDFCRGRGHGHGL